MTASPARDCPPDAVWRRGNPDCGWECQVCSPPSISPGGIREDAHDLSGPDHRRCQATVTCLLTRVWRPSVVLAPGTPAGVSGVHGSGSDASAVTTGRTVRTSGVRDHGPDTVSVLWADRPPLLDGTGRNPLCSDQFLSVGTGSCQLTAGMLKLNPLSNADLLPSDGAYPLNAVVSLSKRVRSQQSTNPYQD